MADTLTRFWTEFCKHFNVQVDTEKKWLDLIQLQHQRPYYDMNYLANKLQHYETCQRRLKDPNAVLLALIFQSTNYVTKASDNLEKCLETFGQFVLETGLNESNLVLTKSVSDLIELSVTDSSNEFWEDGTFGEEDSHYFLDINFAYLAQNWEEYKEFSDKTRKEYEFITDENYIKLRKKILQSFLHIPNIYATSEFRSLFEAKARANIQREIDELNQP